MISRTHHVTVGRVVARLSGSAVSYCVNRLFPATVRVAASGSYGNMVSSSWWAIPVGGTQLTPVAQLHYEHLSTGKVVIGGTSLTRVRFFFRSRIWRHINIGGQAGVISSSWGYVGTGRILLYGNNQPDFCDHYIIIVTAFLRLSVPTALTYERSVYMRVYGRANARISNIAHYYYDHSVNARFTIFGSIPVNWVSDRIVDARGGLRVRGLANIGVFTHIILVPSGGFRLFSRAMYRWEFARNWRYVGTASITVLPNMRVDWVTDYQIEGSGLGTISGNIEIVFVSAWVTVASAEVTVLPDSRHSLALSYETDVRLVLSSDSRYFVYLFCFPVGGVSIAGRALFQLHLVFVVLPRITVDGTAGNSVDYDATLIVGSDSAHGYSVVVSTNSIVSTHMTLQAGQIIVRVGGTRKINTCYWVIPSSGASVWGESTATCPSCYV